MEVSTLSVLSSFEFYFCGNFLHNVTERDSTRTRIRQQSTNTVDKSAAYSERPVRPAVL